MTPAWLAWLDWQTAEHHADRAAPGTPERGRWMSRAEARRSAYLACWNALNDTQRQELRSQMTAAAAA